MTTEQEYNKNAGNCQYNEIAKRGSTIFWERVCGDNNIDYVVGLKYSSSKPPTYKNFDVHREKDICLRYAEREDAEAFLSIRFS